MNKRLEAIIDEFSPPQHDMATAIGTQIPPMGPRVRVAISLARAAEDMISVGVRTAR